MRVAQYFSFSMFVGRFEVLHAVTRVSLGTRQVWMRRCLSLLKEIAAYFIAADASRLYHDQLRAMAVVSTLRQG